MTTWFTSDSHFFHRNIIELANRPFANLDDMHAQLIALHNSVVRPEDEWYHLGDFAFTNKPSKVEEIVNRLNGKGRIILGNHDKDWGKKLPDKTIYRPWEGRPHVKAYQVIDMVINDQQVVLCHYPIASWPGIGHGSWHLHGHSHGKLQQPKGLRRMDVGVDCWGYRPVSFEEIAEYMGKVGDFIPVDHHLWRQMT